MSAEWVLTIIFRRLGKARRWISRTTVEINSSSTSCVVMIVWPRIRIFAEARHHDDRDRVTSERAGGVDDP